jgi:hypothetical protein
LSELKRVTVYVDHVESSADFDWVQNWLFKWEGKAKVAAYSSGGWEHCWDIEAPVEAIEELPVNWLCASEWATPEIYGKP